MFNLNLFQIFLLITLSNAILLFVLLRKFSKRYQKPALFLGLFILGCLIDQANYTLIPLLQSKLSFVIPSIPVLLFLPALFLFFVVSTLVNNFKLTKNHIWFLVPGFVGVVYQLISWIYVLNIEKTDAIHQFITGRSGHFTIQLIAIVWSVICLVRAIRLMLNADTNLPAFRFFKFVFLGILFMLLHWVILFLVDFYAPNSYHQNWQYFFWTLDTLFLLYVGYKIATIPKTLKADKGGFETPQKTELKSYSQKLKQLLTSEKPYLNPELTRKDLADNLGLSEVYVSSILKNGLQTSFYKLINSYRVKEAILLIEKGKLNQITIEALAKEVGFKSKSTFNKAFKEETGTTPSAFINQNQSV